jgi:predicted RNase H-like nuclease/Holliday junction resolvase RusA-like endonuclease
MLWLDVGLEEVPVLDIGVDLAWGQKAWTGLAALDRAGALIDARQVRLDQAITDWFVALADDEVLVAIDAPIIVNNPSGARDCERLIGRHFGRYNASCYPANTSNPAFVHGTRAQRIASLLGLDVDPTSSGQRRAIEVYPHSALVALFELPTVLTYKDRPGRDLSHLRAEMTRLLDLLESLVDAPVAMNVRTCAAWPKIRDAVRGASRKSELAAVEDTLDAIVCAYVARYARLDPQDVRVFGDVDKGYILTPVTAEIGTAFDREERSLETRPPAGLGATTSTRPWPAQRSPRAYELALPGALILDVDVEGRPASYSSAATGPWMSSVAGALERRGARPIDTRFGVSIAFRTPPPVTTNDRWDVDNLVKPTLDAMVAVLGVRPGRFTTPQADDERVDVLLATKRTAATGEPWGARIRVSDLLA